jgi:hypothetical protein
MGSDVVTTLLLMSEIWALFPGATDSAPETGCGPLGRMAAGHLTRTSRFGLCAAEATPNPGLSVDTDGRRALASTSGTDTVQ